jgi:4-amino-4-deoxy-L-arabinose transferase-like glycosyltransferase
MAPELPKTYEHSAAWSHGMHTRLDYRVALALVLGLALFLRVFPLTYSHFWDETVFLQDAKVIVDGRTNYDEFFERPPLLSFAYALGFALWDNIYVANIVQGLWATSAVLFAFLYVRKAFGLLSGLCAAFLLAFGPYFVETSHELLTDMPALALMLAAMWLFDKSGAPFALLAGVAYALSIETRFTSLFLVLYFLLEVALSPKKFRQLMLLGVGAATTLAPYLIWLKWKYDSFFYPFILARRIVQEWTAPVPARFYFEGVRGIFPLSLWTLFALAVLSLVLLWIARARSPGSAAPSENAESLDQMKRQTTLLIWGTAFFAYMLSIPHKEIRYLLPLAIPAVVIAAVGTTRTYQWFARQRTPLRIAGLLLGVFLAAADYGSPLLKLSGPFTDRAEWPEVQIARYLREHSTSADTIYAAHNFPVLAFYSQRRTVSLLPLQEDFDHQWGNFMSQPGFLVYFLPEHIGEIHAVHPALKPDREFLATHPNFVEVQAFPTAIVYRYLPIVGNSRACHRHQPIQ